MRALAQPRSWRCLSRLPLEVTEERILHGRYVGGMVAV